MMTFDLDTYVARSRALDVSGIDWEAIPRHPLSPDAVRVLRYMQDIESHTIIYLKMLLSTRAVDDPEVATFLACWIYEETFHGRALARFLDAAGHPIGPRWEPRSYANPAERLRQIFTGLFARAWRDFVAVHMTWGAINELTTLTGYARLAEVADHPVLTELLARIMRDESRHFAFYYHQAERRLANPRTARITRFLVDHFWAPVGWGVQPAAETRFLASYLMTGPGGQRALRKVDETIRALPGFAGVPLLGAWAERALARDNAPREAAAASGPDREALLA